jgi:hypothetical protein
LLPTVERQNDMGNILAFRPRKPSGGKTTKQGSSPATVIIFPGVRYERTAELDAGAKWSPVNWIAQFQPQPLPTS